MVDRPTASAPTTGGTIITYYAVHPHGQ